MLVFACEDGLVDGFLRWVMHLISITGCWRTRSTTPVKSRNGPSVAFSLVILPSKTNSLSAGTSTSMVLHLTMSVFSNAFAMPNSSTPLGNVVAAANSTAVELPRHIAMSSSPPAFFSALSVPRFSTMRAMKWFLSLSIRRVEAHVTVAGLWVFYDGDG